MGDVLANLFSVLVGLVLEEVPIKGPTQQHIKPGWFQMIKELE
ncbi:hypothetical protein ABH524_006555 [Staphylococcus pasteuri]